MPTVPILKTTAINVYLFFLMFFFGEYYRRLYLFVPEVLEIDVLEERMPFYLLSPIFVPQSLLGLYLEKAVQ